MTLQFLFFATFYVWCVLRKDPSNSSADISTVCCRSMSLPTPQKQRIACYTRGRNQSHNFAQIHLALVRQICAIVGFVVPPNETAAWHSWCLACTVQGLLQHHISHTALEYTCSHRAELSWSRVSRLTLELMKGQSGCRWCNLGSNR